LTGDLQEKTAERLQSPRAWDFISAKSGGPIELQY